MEQCKLTKLRKMSTYQVAQKQNFWRKYLTKLNLLKFNYNNLCLFIDYGFSLFVHYDFRLYDFSSAFCSAEILKLSHALEIALFLMFMSHIVLFK